MVRQSTADLAEREFDAPLAERLRPRTLNEVIGQAHLLGEGKPLRVAFESGHPHSMILWGPPGVGKTSLARLMAREMGAQFIQISAVLGGVKDIRDAVERAQAARMRSDLLTPPQKTIMFVDEVHRFNKAVNDYINQQLIKPIVQFFVLPHCSMGVKHG